MKQSDVAQRHRARILMAGLSTAGVAVAAVGSAGAAPVPRARECRGRPLAGFARSPRSIRVTTSLACRRRARSGPAAEPPAVIPPWTDR